MARDDYQSRVEEALRAGFTESEWSRYVAAADKADKAGTTLQTIKLSGDQYERVSIEAHRQGVELPSSIKNAGGTSGPDEIDGQVGRLVQGE